MDCWMEGWMDRGRSERSDCKQTQLIWYTLFSGSRTYCHAQDAYRVLAIKLALPRVLGVAEALAVFLRPLRLLARLPRCPLALALDQGSQESSGGQIMPKQRITTDAAKDNAMTPLPAEPDRPNKNRQVYAHSHLLPTALALALVLSLAAASVAPVTATVARAALIFLAEDGVWCLRG